MPPSASPTFRCATPITPPISWPRRGLVSFRESRVELERHFGPAQELDADSNGVGLMDIWALRFHCGLETLLLAFHGSADFSEVPANESNWVEVQANTTDFPHLVGHLPFELREMFPFEPDPRTFPPDAWRLVRQDDNGHVFEIGSFSSRCAADAALSKFEGLSHKQTYWLVEIPPGP